jgi:ABC-2 type transport system ATP-binding protein
VALVCDALGHKYGRAVVLNDIAVTLTPGVTGLVGVNGAGKSTLLRAVAGALRPTRGSVRYDGLDPYGRSRRRYLRRVSLMPQALELPSDARVVDAVDYCGWLRGMPAAGLRARSEEVLGQVGLADRRGDRMRTLSGGMVRRVALAQALVSAPDILLLDEPTTGLDPQQRAVLRTLIDELPRDTITVVSSHVMEDLEQLADRIVVLDSGEIAHAGPFCCGHSSIRPALREIASSGGSTAASGIARSSVGTCTDVCHQ